MWGKNIIHPQTSSVAPLELGKNSFTTNFTEHVITFKSRDALFEGEYTHGYSEPMKKNVAQLTSSTAGVIYEEFVVRNRYLRQG